MNRIGPKTEPCGMLLITVAQFESVFPIRTLLPITQKGFKPLYYITVYAITMQFTY